MSTQTITYTAGPICLDELITVQAQYSPEVRWNGFLCPAMDAHAAVTVLDTLIAEQIASGYGTPNEHKATEYDFDGDVLVVTEYDGDEPFAERLHPDADGLYALGAWAWVWSEDEGV